MLEDQVSALSIIGLTDQRLISSELAMTIFVVAERATMASTVMILLVFENSIESSEKTYLPVVVLLISLLFL